MRPVTGGQADVTTYFQMRLLTGGDAGSLTIADFDLTYTRSGKASAAKVNAIALAQADSPHSDNKMIEVSPTDCPALYRVDWPDAAFVAGDKVVVLTVKHTLCFTESLRVVIDAEVNVTKISGSATAADNSQLQWDGTGLTGDTFPSTQAQLGNLSSGSAAINTTAESFTKSGSEPETNTYTSTHTEDGVFHIVQDVGGATDAYYQFDVGGNGVPISITWHGYAQLNGDSYSVWAWNYDATNYEQIGTILGANGTTPMTETFLLTLAHVGTGADLGKVRFRFSSADGAAFATDRVLVSFSVVSHSVGYADGAIWVDTENGTAGTEAFVNGIADKPVDSWADALTLSGALGITRFHIINGSTITLSGDSSHFTLIGNVWTLVLNGQVVDGLYVDGAEVSGIGTGGTHEPGFTDCHLNDMTLPPCHMSRCGLMGTFTAGSAGSFSFDSCHSNVEGTGTPTFDFGVGLNASEVGFRRYSGGIEIKNMGAGTGSYNMSLEGDGQLVINANCSATSTVAIRGLFTVTDNAGGAVTLSDDARLDIAQVYAQVVQVMKTDTTTLPGQEAPPLAPTFEEMVAWLYKVLRNRTDQTATLFRLFADDQTTVDAKATVSDDGTTGIKQELVSGP